MLNTSSKNAYLPNIIQNITLWHYGKDIVGNGDENVQLMKLEEEMCEVIEAFCEGHSHEHCKEEVGDMIVVLVNLCERRGYSLAECANIAYQKINKRKGKTVNGGFVKEEDLK
ncbi:MazG nucleotide pyrophosphohydrolase domain-containing protein [Vibrio cholerae]|uniref:MazG nucleotide pyrophosphohydrolase domain-containing protein n=1 Tax=Vibrio cholerae TaxID=666 RepID=UPI00053C5B3B|nr:MazG nucleotide pyrophosphohydrolase domain-containing protein [Vibrio cholerae]